MALHFGVFEDLLLYYGRFEGGKHFYDNAVYTAGVHEANGTSNKP
jgi:hypothetical protein